MKDVSLDRYFANLRELGLLFHKCWNSLKYKPLIGDAFRGREYVLASHIHGDSGLWEVSYYVIDLKSKLPLSCADNKADALSYARGLLQKHGPRVWSESAGMSKDIADFEARIDAERQEWLAGLRAETAAKGAAKTIPRRRQKIFAESDGKCHYCATTLALDGKWHIEHKMPRALGGGNEPGNLVASCVSCNMKKRDQTDVEFKAKQSKEAA